MITGNTLIWTSRGWRDYANVMIGEKIISFNSDKNITEYDQILEIKQEYVTEGFMGLRSKSSNQLISIDHPLITINNRTKNVERHRIKDVFLQTFRKTDRILFNRVFDPYKYTATLDDIEWSARMISTFSKERKFQYSNELRMALSIAEDLGGIESRNWINTFFNWGIKKSNGHQWRYSTFLRNKDVRDIIFTVGSRTGSGVQWAPKPPLLINRKNSMWLMSISTQQDITAGLSIGWYKNRYEGLAFNLVTNNGSFLARRNGGTFLIACNKK